MVKENLLKRINFYFKRATFLAVTLFVIADLFLGNVVFAKKIEIDDKDVERIKLGLDLMKLATNISMLDDRLKTILNMAIKGGEVSTDMTYGLLVLSTLNEMEFIDMVVSQRYKTEAREYFDSILDDKLNLMNYYRGMGHDLPRVVFGRITGPMSALTLNTFEITDKVVNIFVAFRVLKEVKTYDGLWYYFDLRRNNEPRQIAWDEAKEIMGFAVNPVGFHRGSEREKKITQLELQFAALWDKWGPYTDFNGVKNSFKQQVKNELADTLVSAIKNQELVKQEEKPIFRGITKTTLPILLNSDLTLLVAYGQIIEQVGKLIKEAMIQMGGKIGELTRFGGAQVSQIPEEKLGVETEEIESEIEGLEVSKEELRPENKKTESEDVDGPEIGLEEMQESLDDIAESIGMLTVGMAGLVQDILKPKVNVETEAPGTEDKIEEKKHNEVALCNITGEPTINTVIFNEIAWMGGEVSVNSEWIELKNISGQEINLNGWQILDKDGQIKIIFNNRDRISINGFWLLERTDDESVPGVPADLIYTGALGNTNEALYLFDNNCQLQDKVVANPDWLAGDNSSKRTMERKSDLSWQTSANPGGTSKKENSIGYFEGYVLEGLGGGGGAPPPAPSLSYPKILITEIQISAIENRFIELYNPNDSAVDLTGWYIQRKTETGTTWSSFVSSTKFGGKTIQSKNYFLISRTLQNSDILLGDLTLTENNSLVLKNPNREIVDLVGWGNAQDFETATTAIPGPGESIGRKWSTTTQSYLDTDNNQNDFEIQNPTPKAQNQSPAPPQPETPSLTVVINEIAWMGTSAQNYNDEWLELYNNTNSAIDLTGWKITKNGQDFIAISTSTITASGFYLLERTNSNTTNMAEDQIYTGVLGNNGEKLELRDTQGILIDSVDGSAGWFGGTTTLAYISMERVNSNNSGNDSQNWANNNLITRNGLDALLNKINGTPKSQNSVSKSETQISSLPFDEFNEITLTFLGNPYIIQNNLNVPQNKALKVDPGVTLKFFIPNIYGPGDGAYLRVEGSLKALGQQSKEILFTSTGNIWPGIVFESAAPETEISSQLEYVKIEKARSWEGGIYSAIKVNQKAISIKNSVFENGSNLRGLYLINSSSTIENVTFNNFTGPIDISGWYPTALFINNGAPVVKNSNFSGNYYGITIQTTETCLQNSNFKISANTFNQNTIPIYLTSYGFPCFEQNQVNSPSKDSLNNIFDGILFQGVYILQDTLWQSNLPLIIEKGFPVENATLTVANGVVVKFRYSNNPQFMGYIRVENGAKVITQGIAGNLVTFTSAKENPQAGNWQALWFKAGSSGELNFTKINYGGFGTGIFRNECLIIDASANVVQNSVEKEFCNPYP